MDGGEEENFFGTPYVFVSVVMTMTSSPCSGTNTHLGGLFQAPRATGSAPALVYQRERAPSKATTPTTAAAPQAQPAEVPVSLMHHAVVTLYKLYEFHYLSQTNLMRFEVRRPVIRVRGQM